LPELSEQEVVKSSDPEIVTLPESSEQEVVKSPEPEVVSPAVASSPETPHQFGFVAISGAPNAGKSTLLNRLAGEKLAAVSHKPQTTRFNILSVNEYGPAQVAFVDTPGIAQTTSPIGKLLRKNTSRAIKNADVVVVLVDISHKHLQEECALVNSILTKYDVATVFLAFNKIDKVKDSHIVERAVVFQQFEKIKDFFMISAEDGTGVDQLRVAITDSLPQQEWMYPSETRGNFSRWASEMTMEKIFQNLHEEVPYQTYVDTLALQEDDDGLHIYQDIVVAREGQKPIVLGQKGQMLKHIGTDARIDIARALRRRVHLHLLVKVKSEWMSQTANLIDAGFFDRSV
jgi:GTP-binding protein Era